MARNKSSKFDFAEGLNLFPGDVEEESKVKELFDESALADMEKASDSGKLKWIDVGLIDEDPDNRKIYGDYDTEGLSRSIADAGFRGVILLYPSEVKGRYIIESGHRSLEAAVNAGLSSVPAVINDPPADEIERRKRLTGGNQHRRKYTPTMMAREAQFQYETYEMEKKRNKELGIDDGESLLDKVARDMEISPSQVTKYRQLLSLNKDLQRLADSGDYNWSVLATASQLNEVQQKYLYTRIFNQTKIIGTDKVSSSWLRNEIEEMKYFRDTTDRNRLLNGIFETTKDAIKEEEPKKRVRRTDGAKAIHKSFESLKSGIDSDSMIKKKAIPQIIKELKEMRELIDKKLSELEE